MVGSSGASFLTNLFKKARNQQHSPGTQSATQPWSCDFKVSMNISQSLLVWNNASSSPWFLVAFFWHPSSRTNPDLRLSSLRFGSFYTPSIQSPKRSGLAWNKYGDGSEPWIRSEFGSWHLHMLPKASAWAAPQDLGLHNSTTYPNYWILPRNIRKWNPDTSISV